LLEGRKEIFYNFRCQEFNTATLLGLYIYVYKDDERGFYAGSYFHNGKTLHITSPDCQ